MKNHLNAGQRKNENTKRLRVANILVADDEAHLRSFVCTIVQRMGHKPFEAPDGKQALEIYKTESIDLSIIDIHMPEMAGTEFLHEVKRLDPNAVVIMMTGAPSAETIIRTIEEEGYTYIGKPFQVDHIVGLIERGLAFRRKRLGGEEA